MSVYSHGFGLYCFDLRLGHPASLCACHEVEVNACQNCGPFLGTLNIRCRIIIGIQKGTIILTTTQVASASLPGVLYSSTSRKKKMHWSLSKPCFGVLCRQGLSFGSRILTTMTALHPKYVRQSSTTTEIAAGHSGPYRS